MSDISFQCPDCEGHLVVDAAGAGRDVACPHCGGPLHIPEVPDVPEVPEAPPPQAPAAEPASGGLGEKLHLKKSGEAAWKEHHPQDDAGDPVEVLEKMGLDPNASPAAEEEPSDDGDSHHVEQHGSDINIGQPWQKKHDQWFTEDKRHYHFCYYNPHKVTMVTACGEEVTVRSADPAPTDLSKVKRKAFCKKCQAALK